MLAKKSLGQNFFINKHLATHIVSKILDLSAQPLNQIKIIEIGPGPGAFTQEFIDHGVDPNHIIAIEKDDSLAQIWMNKFVQSRLIHDDVLNIDFERLIKNNGTTMVFGSLPYNISKKIIYNLLHCLNCPPLFFIIQKEVAQKYAGKPDKSALFLSTSMLASSQILLDISPHSFSPRPKVNSSLICFKPDKKLVGQDILAFEEFIYTLFSKRKQKLYKILRKEYNFDLANDQALGELRVTQLTDAQLLNLFKKVQLCYTFSNE